MRPEPSPFAVKTYSYVMSHTAENRLAHLAAQGYAAFELMPFPGHLWPAELDVTARHRLRRFIAAEGLTVTTLNMPNININLAAATVEMRDYSVARIADAIELAASVASRMC